MPPKGDAKAKSKAKPKAEEEAGDRIPAPDRAAFDEATGKIQEAIDALQKEQQALGAKISERSGGKEEFFAQKAELRGQLDEFTNKINELMERKGDINSAMGEKRQEGVEMRQQLNKMKKSIGFSSEADIDERIATIEFKLQTDSLTLKEEKDFLREISDLKKNRPKVSQVNKMESSMANRDLGANLKEQMSIINEQISQYRGGKRQVQEKYSALMESRKEQLGDLPDIIAKRDALGEKIKEKIQERSQLRDEFRQKEREFNQYIREQREARQAKAKEEREEEFYFVPTAAKKK